MEMKRLNRMIFLSSWYVKKILICAYLKNTCPLGCRLSTAIAVNNELKILRKQFQKSH
jgi:hypothetical protein